MRIFFIKKYNEKKKNFVFQNITYTEDTKIFKYISAKYTGFSLTYVYRSLV
jgi:hypothetical protein